jgi:hypothetical protein
MQRHRTVAAAPVRSAVATWKVIEDLILETLRPSPDVDDVEVQRTLNAAASIARLLIAGGHLDKEPLVLVAPPIHLSITTVTGDAALQHEELPSSVPGGATVVEWMIHLPRPAPFDSAIRQVAETHPRLSVEEAGQAASKSRFLGGIDRDALQQRRDGKQ